ncbi:serine/threonine-protein phosphatase with EF-hands 1 [Thalassophryne amazonica]|uniref:serine/threonine-protein phosphatase with EF-hands 1 n=1 Tax=Thalassophryne amazonica TaxID=390379 RepID=UPI001470A868|nr:serine/threonine-protein phosphatase with EF-hands 1 [Thalassophryne amazonica]XP_034050578.1 serine/threonine-protein phosphatase with EF-hands 1 [Thalassophryne amazonica]XP_034050583.1 serine/threonine-protein phosphatase with EF-hands 1 [Thalassophryne amazonica]XP_034050587.1 serine/threonine-protein phosphatase with EF-hands 1 [Thalassophryne amazonica]XP_034050598.1 serine/threonine-protein phosphatase with EF-hands 1 [Thalassophryne amazonica]
MGCGTSVATEMQQKSLETDEAAITPSPALTMKAVILIQQWYRRYVARLEMRRRYTWNIFQSIEYAQEQDQLQLSSFFSFMLDHFTPLNGNGSNFISQLLHPVVEPWLDRDNSYEFISVPESYTGPRLTFPLSVSDTNVLLSAFKEVQLLHARYVLQLLCETKKLLKQMPNVIHLSTSYTKEITICGDLHGHLDDLLLIFYKNGLPSAETPYVFNGDFVDRGKKSFEVVILLFSYLLLYPDHVHLNRGNHEDHIMNLRYGFAKEVMHKYKTHGDEILQLFQDVFSLLPVAAVIDGKILIVHGGISDCTDLDFLSSIERQQVKSALKFPKFSFDQLGIGQANSQTKRVRSTDSSHSKSQRTPNQRKRRPGLSQHDSGTSSSSSSSSSLCSPRTPSYRSSPSRPCTMNTLQAPFLDSMCAVSPLSLPQQEQEWKQIVDILWSDPRTQEGCRPNTFRGGGCYFGPDVTHKLLLQHGLQLLVRSHECKQEGYELCHEGQVITIFSASNYYEEGSNRGAYIKVGRELVPRFYQYQVSPSTRKLTLTQRVRAAEGSALRALKEKLFAHRSELIAGFQQYDAHNTGTVSVGEWAQVLEAVLRLDLPWRTLRPHLAYLAPDGTVKYESSFEDVGAGIPLPQVTPNMAETLFRYRTDIEIIFNIIDKDHSGLISIEEFRHTWRLFSSHLGVNIDDKAIDDLAHSIDFNKDGSIDFNEFLDAFRVVHNLEYKDQLHNEKGS